MVHSIYVASAGKKALQTEALLPPDVVFCARARYALEKMKITDYNLVV